MLWNDVVMKKDACGQGFRKKSLLDRFKDEIKFYQAVLKDSRTPKLSKFFLGLAVGYALNPIDLIPDFIPILGYLDDLIIVPVLIFIAVRLIPKEIMREHRMVQNNARR
jgi:uncharacterized membrane protein YkvA (DUF1232 family)